MVVRRITAWADTQYANAAEAINETMARLGANEACNELLVEMPEEGGRTVNQVSRFTRSLAPDSEPLWRFLSADGRPISASKNGSDEAEHRRRLYPRRGRAIARRARDR